MSLLNTSDLVRLNTKRWHQQGELKRLTGLIHRILREYPDLPKSSALSFIDVLNNECTNIQTYYELNKQQIKGARKIKLVTK